MAKKKKTGKKSAKKSPVKKKAGARGASLAPKPVKTGKGPSPMDLGVALMRQINAGDFEPNKDLWSKNVVSVEGLGVNLAWHGMKATQAKGEEWYRENEITALKAEGPYVGASGFSVKFDMTVRKRATGEEIKMNEVGVYTVDKGKIVREEFMYGME